MGATEDTRYSPAAVSHRWLGQRVPAARRTFVVLRIDPPTGRRGVEAHGGGQQARGGGRQAPSALSSAPDWLRSSRPEWG